MKNRNHIMSSFILPMPYQYFGEHDVSECDITPRAKDHPTLASRGLKFQGIMIGSMSGSIGGATYAKAKGGITYIRERVTPTNPRTFLQTAIRSAVSSVSAAWVALLTEVEQQAWFDASTGAQSGKALFGKVNQNRIYANNTGRAFTTADVAAAPLALVTSPPESFSTDFTAPSIVIDDSANTLKLGVIAGGAWNADATTTTPSVVYVYTTAGQTASRGSRRFSYQLVRAFTVDTNANVTFPAINLAALGLPTITGYVMYVKVYVQGRNGENAIAVEQRVTIVA